MKAAARRSLLPEEDALDDLDEDDEADPTVPGDLWFRDSHAGSSGRVGGHRILRDSDVGD